MYSAKHLDGHDPRQALSPIFPQLLSKYFRDGVYELLRLRILNCLPCVCRRPLFGLPDIFQEDFSAWFRADPSNGILG